MRIEKLWVYAFSLTLHKIGCGSAKDFKQAWSSALALHYLCIR